MSAFNSTNCLKTFLVITALLLSGCTAKDNRMYYWGNYESMVYAHHLQADEVSLQLQIETLTQDIDKAAASGKPVAPGIYAHLGMLYASIGDLNSAVDALNREKQSFPESNVLIDGFIQRINATKTAEK